MILLSYKAEKTFTPNTVGRLLLKVITRTTSTFLLHMIKIYSGYVLSSRHVLPCGLLTWRPRRIRGVLRPASDAGRRRRPGPRPQGGVVALAGVGVVLENAGQAVTVLVAPGVVTALVAVLRRVRVAVKDAVPPIVPSRVPIAV